MKRNNNIWRENMLSERRGKEESKERENGIKKAAD